MAELKSCKYCGGSGIIKHGKDRVTVECAASDYAACVFISSDVSAEQAERKAIERWNDRNLNPDIKAKPADDRGD